MSRKNRIPFATTTSVSLSYVAASFAGVKADFDTSKLINSFRVPIEVMALRILIEPRPSEAVTDLVLAPFIYLEAKLGKHYLTDGPVPVSILAPYRKWEAGQEVFATADDFSQLSMRTIVLPRPLFLRPGVGFAVQASIPADSFTSGTNAFASNFSVNVHVAVLGRFIGDGEKIPEMHELPMVSFGQMEDRQKYLLLETDLRNPLSKSIRVHRLTGTKIVSHNPGTEVMNEEFTTRSTTDFFQLRYPDGSLAMSEDRIEFTHVFGQMRTWPASFDLAANQRLVARVTKSALGGTAVRGFQIGLFATRPEVVQ